jgi:hypothetical protein
VPARLSGYIGQSPLTVDVCRDCAASTVPMMTMKARMKERVMTPEYNLRFVVQ